MHGFDLVIGGSSDRVEEAAAALGLNGVRVVPVRSDLATYEGVEAVWKAVQDTGQPLAAAALNAGIGIGGSFVDTALEDELRMIAINGQEQVPARARQSAPPSQDGPVQLAWRSIHWLLLLSCLPLRSVTSTGR